MSTLIDLAVLLLGLVGSAAYSGSEIAFYSVSRARIDVEARQGIGASRLVRRLLEDDLAFLIVVLIGNCLMVELITWSAEDLLRERNAPGWAIRVVQAAVLTPGVFFFADVLPKNLFRRRPHALISRTASFILLSRALFWPLERLLFLLTTGLTRLFGLSSSQPQESEPSAHKSDAEVEPEQRRSDRGDRRVEPFVRPQKR